MIEIIRQKITTPDAWIGPEIKEDGGWLLHLGDAAVAEIDAALAHAKSQGASIPFTADMFPLPTFVTELDGLIDQLGHGLGFTLVRGLPREKYSDADCGLIYWGIGVHLGRPVSQNIRGHLLGHVTDEGRELSDPNARAYQTRAKLDFHCDQLPVDMLGLFCLHPARVGGASYLVSSTSIHNVLLAERPDLLEVLYRPFHIDWRGDEPPGEQPWYTVPMYSAREGKVTSRFPNRAFMESVSRFDDELALTDVQREAVDFVQEVAARPDMYLSMGFQKGDMQFVNNHTILHARDSYEDYGDPERKRRLLRMWIALPDARRRPLSPQLDHRYRYVEIGGIPKRDAA